MSIMTASKIRVLLDEFSTVNDLTRTRGSENASSWIVEGILRKRYDAVVEFGEVTVSTPGYLSTSGDAAVAPADDQDAARIGVRAQGGFTMVRGIGIGFFKPPG